MNPRLNKEQCGQQNIVLGPYHISGGPEPEISEVSEESEESKEESELQYSDLEESIEEDVDYFSNEEQTIQQPEYNMKDWQGLPKIHIQKDLMNPDNVAFTVQCGEEMIVK